MEYMTSRAPSVHVHVTVGFIEIWASVFCTQPPTPPPSPLPPSISKNLQALLKVYASVTTKATWTEGGQSMYELLNNHPTSCSSPLFFPSLLT